MTEVIGKVETITRARAEALLAGMVPNRNIRAKKVEQYAADMRAGRFVVNGQGLVVSDEGHLLDGQNRMRAFLASGLPEIEMLVVRGVRETAFVTLDSGAVRYLADFITIEKMPNGKVLSGIARLAYNYAAGWMSGSTPSRTALLDFVHRHPAKLIEAASWAASARDVVRTSPFGAVLFLATESGKHHDTAREFVHGVATGLDLTLGDPRYTLREWVAKGMKKRDATALTADMVFGATIRAWNAFAYDRPLTTIKNLAQVTVRSMPIVGYDQKAFPDVPLYTPRPETQKQIEAQKQARSRDDAEHERPAP
jgi:hypothetical protein